MRVLFLYLLSFVLLDALVPRSCSSSGGRPYPPAVEVISCDQGENTTALQLSYGPQGEERGRWSVYVTAEAAELRYLISADSVAYSEEKPMTAELFEALKDSINELNLSFEYYGAGPDFRRGGEEETELIIYSDSDWQNYINCRATSGDTYDGFWGDAKKLRGFFSCIFADHFEDDLFVN